MAKDDTIEALTQLVRKIIKSERGANGPFVQATFVSAETADADLSVVTINGTTVRRVRKHKEVGAMTAGEQLTCIQGNGTPLTIIGRVTGNITKTG